MEEIQNIGQPEGLPEVSAAEILPEIEAVAEQPEQEPTDAPEDAPEENGSRDYGEIWTKLKEFLIKRKRLVIYVAVALVVALVAILVIHRNRVGKNRYETLVQTITEMKGWFRTRTLSF